MCKAVQLRTIQLLDYEQNLAGYDFYPARTFRKSVHVVLWPKESLFNIHYLKLFRDCDLGDIQVTVHCVRNLLPIASLIAHRVIVQETRQMAGSVFNPRASISSYGFDLKLQEKLFDIRKWHLGPGWNFGRYRELLPKSGKEVEEIAGYYESKPAAIEQSALEWFRTHQGLFPKDRTDVELKIRWSRLLERRLIDLGDPTFIGIDKTFQHQLITQYPACGQFFLSLQLLAGLYNGWSFIGIYGAGSVFSLLFPVNLLLAMDRGNLCPAMNTVRSYLNQSYYGIPTIGSSDGRRNFADCIAANDQLFQDTILAALDNRQRARCPAVCINDAP